MIPQLLIDNTNDTSEIQKFAKELHKATYMSEKLRTGQNIWIRADMVRRPLEAPYTGPFKVLQHISKYYLIKLNEVTHTRVFVDRLKPYVEVSNTYAKQIDNTSTKEKTNPIYRNSRKQN